MGYFSFWVAPFHHIISRNKQDEFKALLQLIALVLPDINPRNFPRIFWWFFILSYPFTVDGSTVGHVNE